MHADHEPYFKFTNRSRLEKSINSLIGIVEGIAIDSMINSSEMNFLKLWLGEHVELRDRHPFNELVPVVQQALTDGVLSPEEKEDILWLCERLRSADYFNEVTADLQRLHALMAGIVADGVISETELRGLSEWLVDHEHLRTCWPYEEVGSLVTSALADKKIDENEHSILKKFFSEFLDLLDEKTIVEPSIMQGSSMVGLCAVCPEIRVEGSAFCFTGKSNRYTRRQFSDLVERLGGEVLPGVSVELDYLIIGSDGNPCWAYACYGRKVEKAVELRKSGVRLLLVHENDFHDAVADLVQGLTGGI